MGRRVRVVAWVFVGWLVGLGGDTASVRSQDRVGPFTSPPRSVRSREVDQQHIRLEMNVDLEKQEFTARAVHTLQPYQPLDRLVLDAANLQIDRVTLLSGTDATT